MFRRRRPDAAPEEAGAPTGDAPSKELVVALPPARHRLRRSWPQRLVLGVNLLLVVACFATAVGLYLANDRLGDRQTTTIVRSAPGQLANTPFAADPGSDPDDTSAPPGTDVGDANGDGNLDGEVLPFPEVDVAAQNWLVTGIDNGDCVVAGQAPAANIGDRTNMGERGDTIMLIRIDPPANQAAILSFPRDLWVNIAGSTRKSRINSAYTSRDPSRLVQTIEQNFFLPVDHYIAIDFCAFKAIVEAVGGVKVPFPYAVRDQQLGFSIPAPGCYELGPEASLDYVRSRYYQYQEPSSGEWKRDPTSDFGRISRQQDFIRRALQKAFDKGVRDPRVAWSLLNTGIDYVNTDDRTTPQSLLDLALAMRNLDPGGIRSYTIEARPMKVGNNSVLDPRINTENMEQVLRVFRGEARLADAPEQLFEAEEATTTLPVPTTLAPTTTTGSTVTTGTGGTTTATSSPTTTTTTTTTSTTTLPLVLPEENTAGIVPPDDPTCR